MVFNHECERKILISLEKNLKLKTNGTAELISVRELKKDEELLEFTDADINYCILKLIEIKYITAMNPEAAPRVIRISDITYSGHDYLNAVRDEKIWKAVKEKTKMFSSVAMDIVKNMAIEATKGMLGMGSIG